MPSTEYRGYTIRYSENEDVWTCYDVGASHEKLSRVKAKIDEMHRKLRKANAFHCLTVSSYGGVSAEEATIVEYLGPIRAKTSAYQRVGDGNVIDHEVAFMSARGGFSDKKTRQKGKLSDLSLGTEENLRRISEAKKLYDEAKKIEGQSREILKMLDRPTVDQIAELIAASEYKFEETDQ
jgi:hypothetical protein